LILISVAICLSCNSQYHANKLASAKVAIRAVGHQLLLINQDSTSIIKPVLIKKPSVYNLSFNASLSFKPDQLVSIVDSIFNVASLQEKYRVEVLQCIDHEVAYSFEIHQKKERTIIPCTGRLLPNACYTINFSFLEQSTALGSRARMLGLLGLCLSAIVLIYYFKKPKSPNTFVAIDSNFQSFGLFKFYPKQNKLVIAATDISLSKKECELLAIFIANPNQIIKREELTKSVWEDNGVFVGRSLDTYISKLRKKLQGDDAIKLTNVHGVGYKLEVL